MGTSCPNEEMIADYIEGRLSDKETYVVEKHLCDCDQCLIDFQVSINFLRDTSTNGLDDVPEKVTQAAIDLINSQDATSPVAKKSRLKQLVDDFYSKVYDAFIWTSLGQWRLAPIRGPRKVSSKDIIRIKKVFKELMTEIEIEKIRGNKTNIRVKLLKYDSARPGIRVTLKRDDREILSHLIDDQDVTLFEDIPFGRYCLAFTRDGTELGIYRFDIKESPNE